MNALILALTMATAASDPTADPKLLAGMPGSSKAKDLQVIVDRAVQTVRDSLGNAAPLPDSMAVTLVDLTGKTPRWASYRGDVPIYPASVVKVFYLRAAHQWMQDGKLTDSEELRRALRDMIVDSSNDATSYVVDVLTGTTSGPELPPDELATWAERRNAMNRYYDSIGYRGINVNKKPWGDGPYGRETQASAAFKPSRNQLTTDATARLLTEIVLGRAVDPARSAEMLELMKRDPFLPTTDIEEQNTNYTGIAAVPGMKLWSKAGWTSRVRHDAAYVELPNGPRFVLVTFTDGRADERNVIPTVARSVMRDLSSHSRHR
jgi:hypothetical protein